MGELRTRETVEKYRAAIADGVLERGCRLCDMLPIKNYTYWKIVENEFPYDLVADVHHMLLPKRHTSENELTNEELTEYVVIREEIMESAYEWIMEATRKKKSIPAHYHLHLITAKESQETP